MPPGCGDGHNEKPNICRADVAATRENARIECHASSMADAINTL